MILLQLRAFLVSSEKNLLLYFFFQLTMRNIWLCLEIDDDNNQFPLLFSCGFVFHSAPVRRESDFATSIYFLVVVL